MQCESFCTSVMVGLGHPLILIGHLIRFSGSGGGFWVAHGGRDRGREDGPSPRTLSGGVLCEVLVLSGPHVVGLGLGGAGDTVRTLGCFKMSSIFDLQTLATQKA
ncbi:unnamed protein product [Arctogadus glacialis]